MNSNYIQLIKALDLMDQIDDDGKPVKFQVKFVNAVRIRRTGGEIIEIKSGRKCVGNRNGKTVFDKRNLGYAKWVQYGIFWKRCDFR